MASMIARRVSRALASAISRPRALMSSSVAVEELKTPQEMAYPANIHRSNAQELVSKVPVIEVDSLVAMCDGSSVGGHPIEFIKLDKREGKGPAVCKFCGLRYKASAHAGHGH